jgi:hypothetical protein
VRDTAAEARKYIIELSMADHDEARCSHNEPTDTKQRQGDPHRVSSLMLWVERIERG